MNHSATDHPPASLFAAVAADVIDDEPQWLGPGLLSNLGAAYFAHLVASSPPSQSASFVRALVGAVLVQAAACAFFGPELAMQSLVSEWAGALRRWLH